MKLKLATKEYLDEEIRRLEQTLAGLKPSGEIKKATEEYIAQLKKTREKIETKPPRDDK